jgi:hypothetical protein
MWERAAAVCGCNSTGNGGEGEGGSRQDHIGSLEALDHLAAQLSLLVDRDTLRTKEICVACRVHAAK